MSQTVGALAPQVCTPLISLFCWKTKEFACVDVVLCVCTFDTTPKFTSPIWAHLLCSGCGKLPVTGSGPTTLFVAFHCSTCWWGAHHCTKSVTSSRFCPHITVKCFMGIHSRAVVAQENVKFAVAILADNFPAELARVHAAHHRSESMHDSSKHKFTPKSTKRLESQCSLLSECNPRTCNSINVHHQNCHSLSMESTRITHNLG